MFKISLINYKCFEARLRLCLILLNLMHQHLLTISQCAEWSKIKNQSKRFTFVKLFTTVSFKLPLFILHLSNELLTSQELVQYTFTINLLCIAFETFVAVQPKCSYLTKTRTTNTSIVEFPTIHLQLGKHKQPTALQSTAKTHHCFLFTSHWVMLERCEQRGIKTLPLLSFSLSTTLPLPGSPEVSAIRTHEQERALVRRPAQCPSQRPAQWGETVHQARPWNTRGI